MMPTAEGGGRRVLVTGGAQGIGRAITQFLMDRGHHVAVLDRTDVQEPGLIVVRADLSDSTEVARAVDGAVDALGGLDVLVNNAGCRSGRMGSRTTMTTSGNRCSTSTSSARLG